MEDKYCKKCGAVCPSEFKFCPNCGASLQAEKCAVCGAELVEGAKFCVNCGAKIGASEATEATDISETPEVAEEITAENGAEENVVNDVPAEPQTTAEDINATPAVKTEARENTVAPKKDPSKKKYVVRVIKNSVVFALCIILFALSFCGVVAMDMEEITGLISGATDQPLYDVDFDGMKVEITAVDLIGIMGATANVGNESKYEDEIADLGLDLTESLKNDYNQRLGKFILSDKTKEIIEDIVICSLKGLAALEENQYGPTYNNIIIAGVFSLLNILFSFAMLVVSAISFFFVLFKKKNTVSKFLYALPVYLFLSMMILFIVKTTAGVGSTVAGAMGATLFFGIVALIVAVLFVVLAGKSKPIKNAIPKFVSLGMSLIVCACMFAPVMTAKYDLVLKNKRTKNTYSVSIDAGGLVTYLPPEEIKEYEQDPDATTENYWELVQTYLDHMSDMTSHDMNSQEGEVATAILLQLMVVAIGEYSLTGALSIGYYALLIVFILFASFAIATVATLHEKKDKFYPLLITAIVFIVVALACSVGWICVLNYNLEDLALSFTVGGGLIAGVLVAIVGMITSSVLVRVFNRPAKSADSKPIATYSAEEE